MKTLHPEWTNFLENNPDVSHDEPGRSERFFSNPGNAHLETRVNIKSSSIPGRDKYQIPIRVYTAKETKKLQGIVIFFHSGGFLVGSLETEDISCRYMALAGPLIVISVEYRLCPEYVYPTPMNDAWDASKYIISNICSFAPNAPKPLSLVICGTSSGGHLAGIVSQKARDLLQESSTDELRAKVIFAGVLLRAPVTARGTDSEFIPPDFRDSHNSWSADLDTLLLDRGNMKENHDALKVPANEITSPEAYPLWGDFTGLPKMYIQICEVDILRDDGLCYLQGLQVAGVAVRKTFYKDLPHIFWVYGPDLEVAKRAQEDAVKGLLWLLGTKA